MTKQELLQFLAAQGWKECAAKDLVSSGLINWTLPLGEWRKSFVGVFCSRQPERLGVLRYLAASLGKTPKWSDFTKPNMADFVRFLTSHTSRNSAKTYVAIVKGILNVYEENLPSSGVTKVMSVKGEPSQHVALTEEEVERIHRYQPKSETESDIKRAFMLECLCGARSCDVATLSESNIKDGWLTYISQKTKTETSVPVHRLLLQYLSMPAGKPHVRSVVCDTIKRICRSVGITSVVRIFTHGKWVEIPKCELVGSHTARRSFATQLALRGVPVPTISKLMGHSNTKMTSRYICIDRSDIGDTAMAFFN